ncbi:hypothetical protein JKP88DRAFT_249678 [Tribonema minus]|uniref:Uncharacterized protein n=1 Tax=Tribonema minus TaxID=303371 RepID=A0A835YS32_9STRA|nr:hypothetical protein JKP88DRAFT_249678 [Tribonema minus]
MPLPRRRAWGNIAWCQALRSATPTLRIISVLSPLAAEAVIVIFIDVFGCLLVLSDSFHLDAGATSCSILFQPAHQAPDLQEPATTAVIASLGGSQPPTGLSALCKAAVSMSEPVLQGPGQQDAIIKSILGLPSFERSLSELMLVRDALASAGLFWSVTAFLEPDQGTKATRGYTVMTGSVVLMSTSSSISPSDDTDQPAPAAPVPTALTGSGRQVQVVGHGHTFGAALNPQATLPLVRGVVHHQSALAGSQVALRGSRAGKSKVELLSISLEDFEGHVLACSSRAKSLVMPSTTAADGGSTNPYGDLLGPRTSPLREKALSAFALHPRDRSKPLVAMVRSLRQQKCLELLQQSLLHMPPLLQQELSTLSCVLTVPANHSLLPSPMATARGNRAALLDQRNQFVCFVASAGTIVKHGLIYSVLNHSSGRIALACGVLADGELLGCCLHCNELQVSYAMTAGAGLPCGCGALSQASTTLLASNTSAASGALPPVRWPLYQTQTAVALVMTTREIVNTCLSAESKAALELYLVSVAGGQQANGDKACTEPDQDVLPVTFPPSLSAGWQPSTRPNTAHAIHTGRLDHGATSKGTAPASARRETAAVVAAAQGLRQLGGVRGVRQAMCMLDMEGRSTEGRHHPCHRQSRRDMEPSEVVSANLPSGRSAHTAARHQWQQGVIRPRTVTGTKAHQSLGKPEHGMRRCQTAPDVATNVNFKKQVIGEDAYPCPLGHCSPIAHGHCSPSAHTTRPLGTCTSGGVKAGDGTQGHGSPTADKLQVLVHPRPLPKSTAAAVMAFKHMGNACRKTPPGRSADAPGTMQMPHNDDSSRSTSGSDAAHKAQLKPGGVQWRKHSAVQRVRKEPADAACMAAPACGWIRFLNDLERSRRLNQYTPGHCKSEPALTTGGHKNNHHRQEAVTKGTSTVTGLVKGASASLIDRGKSKAPPAVLTPKRVVTLRASALSIARQAHVLSFLSGQIPPTNANSATGGGEVSDSAFVQLMGGMSSARRNRLVAARQARVDVLLHEQRLRVKEQAARARYQVQARLMSDSHEAPAKEVADPDRDDRLTARQRAKHDQDLAWGYMRQLEVARVQLWEELRDVAPRAQPVSGL